MTHAVQGEACARCGSALGPQFYLLVRHDEDQRPQTVAVCPGCTTESEREKHRPTPAGAGR